MQVVHRVAIITGGAGALGYSFALKLLHRDFRVCLLDVDKARGLDTQAELRQRFEDKDEHVDFFECDVSNRDAFASTIEGLFTEFGRLDLMVNNAALATTGFDDWDRVCKVNLESVVHGTKLAIQHMQNPVGKGGVILNIGSYGGFHFMNEAPVYCATKHGVTAFTRSLTHLKERNIIANCFCPAYIDTPMTNQESFSVLAKKFGSLLTASEAANAFDDLVVDSFQQKYTGKVIVVTPDEGVKIM